jgi:hypothetical protein
MKLLWHFTQKFKVIFSGRIAKMRLEARKKRLQGEPQALTKFEKRA